MFHNYIEKKFNKYFLTENSVKLMKKYSPRLCGITSLQRKHIFFLPADLTVSLIISCT